MLKAKINLLPVVLLGTLLLFGCRSATVKTEPVTEKPAASLNQPSAKKEWEVKWQALVKAAQKEGMVVVPAAGWGRPELDGISNLFKSQYGITVETITGRGGEMAEKLLREQKAGLRLNDVFLTGTQTALLQVKPAGLLTPLDSVFILPELKEPELIKKTWFEGKLKWVDADHTMIQLLSYPSLPIVINSDLVKPGEISSYKDLLNPKWKGKIVIDDPSVNGPGSKWFTVTGGEWLGWDFMRDIIKQDAVISRDWRQEVEWVAQGKKAVAIAPLSTIVLEFQKAGVPLKEVEPVEGVYTTQGGWGLTVLKDPAHPNAAKLFANWVLTKDALTIISKFVGRSTSRLDVPVDHLALEQRLQPGRKYFDAEDEKFIIGQAEYMKIAREIFGSAAK